MRIVSSTWKLWMVAVAVLIAASALSAQRRSAPAAEQEPAKFYYVFSAGTPIEIKALCDPTTAGPQVYECLSVTADGTAGYLILARDR